MKSGKLLEIHLNRKVTSVYMRRKKSYPVAWFTLRSSNGKTTKAKKRQFLTSVFPTAHHNLFTASKSEPLNSNCWTRLLTVNQFSN